jgi:hypothetical protein
MELRGIRNWDLFERICRGLEMTPRKMQVNRRRFQVRVAEHHLNAS